MEVMLVYFHKNANNWHTALINIQSKAETLQLIKTLFRDTAMQDKNVGKNKISVAPTN